MDTFNVDLEQLAAIAAIAEQTSIWRPLSVDEEPRTRLFQWQVYEVKNPDGSGWDIHFSGSINPCGGEGRVCSAVQEFNKETMCGITRSGRIYELVDKPGYSSNGDYVWSRWISMYNNVEHRNVTDMYL